jgi:DNA-binding transcriptional LysR family regulator
MDLWQLRIFCKVIEHRSFSRAAHAIHLSQPTISSHIQALERHFGCRLIDRLAKEALPTSAGSVLQGYALKLMALSDETEAAMAAHLGATRGHLRVGASTIPGTYLLPAVIGGFTRRYPQVQVSLQIADSQQILERVLGGDLEIGVIGSCSADPAAVQEALHEDELRLVVPAGHPWAAHAQVTPAELADHPFVVREPGSGTLAALEAGLQRAGMSLDQLRIVAEMGNTAAVIQAIKSGVGVSILSPIAVAEELARGTLVALPVQGLVLKRSFLLTRHRQRTPSPLGRIFAQFLRDVMGDPGAHGRPL